MPSRRLGLLVAIVLALLALLVTTSCPSFGDALDVGLTLDANADRENAASTIHAVVPHSALRIHRELRPATKRGDDSMRMPAQPMSPGRLVRWREARLLVPGWRSDHSPPGPDRAPPSS